MDIDENGRLDAKEVFNMMKKVISAWILLNLKFNLKK